ncbi:MAG: spore germination protein [Firmicutes bacterium]|nr:spore germination protein [Bacillota bacterium]
MMRDKPLIGVAEASALIFLSLVSRILLAHVIFFGSGKEAAWIFPVVDTILALAVVYLLAVALKREPDLNLAETGEKLVGPYLNIIFCLFYLAIFVVGAGLTLRQLGDMAVNAFLPNTPLSLVLDFFLAGPLVVAYLGLEAVARTARFFVLIIVVSIVALILMTLPLWHLDAIYPLWGPGWHDILKGLSASTGDYVYILIWGFIYPFLPREKALSIGLRSVTAAGTVILVFVLASIFVFTYPTITELADPIFEVARVVSLGRFGQRLEIVFLPIRMFSNLILLSISVYIGSSVLASLARVSDNRPFLLAVGVFTMVVAFLAPNAPQNVYWTHMLVSQYTFYIMVGILLVLIGAGLLKGRGNGDGR